MIARPRSTNFYSGVINKLVVIRHPDNLDSLSFSAREFIKDNFNDRRNYKEFNQHIPLKEIVEVKSTSLIALNEFKKGDAILLNGFGRMIDKQSYEFACECFKHGIPVFFIKSTNDCCNFTFVLKQHNNHTLVTKTKDSTKFYIAPEKYFMEISDDSKLTLCKSSDSLYALLPGMVPITI